MRCTVKMVAVLVLLLAASAPGRAASVTMIDCYLTSDNKQIAGDGSYSLGAGQSFISMTFRVTSVGHQDSTQCWVQSDPEVWDGLSDMLPTGTYLVTVQLIYRDTNGVPRSTTDTWASMIAVP